MAATPGLEVHCPDRNCSCSPDLCEPSFGACAECGDAGVRPSEELAACYNGDVTQMSSTQVSSAASRPARFQDFLDDQPARWVQTAHVGQARRGLQSNAAKPVKRLAAAAPYSMWTRAGTSHSRMPCWLPRQGAQALRHTPTAAASRVVRRALPSSRPLAQRLQVQGTCTMLRALAIAVASGCVQAALVPGMGK